MNKKDELNKLKSVLMNKIKLENDDRYKKLSTDEVMKTVIDSSINGKYVFWVLREYLKSNIQRFEDMERVGQALILFKNNLNKFTEQQKQLNKMSFQDLETLVSPYQDVLTQNAVKRMNKEKIWSEIDVIYEGAEGSIYIPKTHEASVFLGKGTKWCTASNSKHTFEYYNKQGPLYVFVLNKKDEHGREIKYQLHIPLEQFMNSKDNVVSLSEFLGENKLRKIFGKVFSYDDVLKFIEQKNKLICNIVYYNHYTDTQKEIILEKIIKKFGLGFIDRRQVYLSNKLYKMAIELNSEDLIHIPKNLITQELCELAVKNNGLALRGVPCELITAELCELAVSQSGHALEYVPENFLTKKLCETAILLNPRTLKFIPEKYLTNKIYKFAVKKDPYVLKNIGEENLTKELCKIAIKEKFNSLQYIPDKYMDDNLVFDGLKSLFARKKTVIKTNFEETLRLMFSFGNKLNDIFVRLDYVEMNNFSANFLKNKFDEYKKNLVLCNTVY